MPHGSKRSGYKVRKTLLGLKLFALMLSLSLQLIDNFLELLLDEEESLGCHDFFVKVLVERKRR